MKRREVVRGYRFDHPLAAVVSDVEMEIADDGSRALPVSEVERLTERAHAMFILYARMEILHKKELKLDGRATEYLIRALALLGRDQGSKVRER